MKTHLTKFLSVLLMFLFFLPITSLFVQETILRLGFSAAAAILLAPVIVRLLAAWQVRRARRHFQEFLQNMASRLNSGQALRFSLEVCLAQMQEQSSGTRFASNLRKVRKAIELQAPYRTIIPLLSSAFPCPEAPPFFALLENPERLGDRLRTLFRYYEQNVRESQNERESLEAEQARSLTESVSLAVMPVLLLLGLTRFAADYMELAYLTAGGKMMLSIAYVLFLLSCVFLYRIFLPGPEKALPKILPRAKEPGNPEKIKRSYQTFTPAFLKERHKDAISVLQVTNYEQSEVLFLRKLMAERIRYGLYGLTFIALSISFDFPLWFTIALPCLLLIFPDYQLLNLASEWRYRVFAVLPDLFTYLLICLRSGNSVNRSFAMAEDSFAKSQVLSAELFVINQKLLNRQALQTVLDEFIRRLGLPEASMFVRLLSQYGAGGDKTDLELMELQVQQLRHVLKEKKRKKEARQANRYLLPMVMDLLAVMLISLAPVIPSFQF